MQLSQCYDKISIIWTQSTMTSVVCRCCCYCLGLEHQWFAWHRFDSSIIDWVPRSGPLWLCKLAMLWTSRKMIYYNVIDDCFQHFLQFQSFHLENLCGHCQDNRAIIYWKILLVAPMIGFIYYYAFTINETIDRTINDSCRWHRANRWRSPRCGGHLVQLSISRYWMAS